MARHSAPSPFAHIRDLFTAAERKILDSSFGSALARATHDQLNAASRQARSLRDKWRDLSASQGRKTKRASGAASTANARSNDKADAFHAAVERFEKRLAELVTTVGATIGGKGTHPRAKARDKKIASRASRRTAPRPEKPVAATPRPAAAPAPKPAPAVKPAAAAPAARPPVVKPIAAPAAPRGRVISKKARVSRAGLVPQTGTQPVGLDRAKQRSARSAAKAGTFTLGGAKTRRTTHLVATTKRNQARRDGRKR